jgi:chloramphenicol-sensitive protein RarD
MALIVTPYVQENHATSAVLSAVLAFGLWGVLPVYWKQIGHLGSDVALAQRVVWTMATVLPLLILRGEWAAFMKSVREPKAAADACLVGVSARHQLGRLRLGGAARAHHRLQPRLLHQSAAERAHRQPPAWRASVVAAKAQHRLRRVRCGDADRAGGPLSMDRSAAGGQFCALRSCTASLTARLVARTGRRNTRRHPDCRRVSAWSQQSGAAIWGTASTRDLLLIIGLGIITTIPLLGFAHAARQLPFALLGVLQFLAPTGQFLVGALVYHEPVSAAAMVSFGLIWTGVVLFCGDLWSKQ